MKNAKFTGILICLVALAITATTGLEILRGATLHSPPRPAPESTVKADEPTEEVRALLKVQQTLTAGVLLYHSYMTSDRTPLYAQDAFRQIQESHKTDLLFISGKIAEKDTPPLPLFGTGQAPQPPPELQTMTQSALTLEEELSAACRAALESTQDGGTKALVMAVYADSSWASRVIGLMSKV